MIATPKGDMDNENAKIGLYITLSRPTRPMTQEAGIYVPEHYPNHRYPSVPMLTIQVIRNGTQVEYPRFAPEATLFRAPTLPLSHPAPSRLTATVALDITAIGRTRPESPSWPS